MIWAAYPNREKSGCNEVRNNFTLLEKKRKRTWPECFSKRVRYVRNTENVRESMLNRGHMYYQRVEFGAVLCLKDPGYSIGAQRVCRQAINSFRWDSHQFPPLKEFLCFLYIFTCLSHALTKLNVMPGFLLCLVFSTALFFSAHAQKEDRV